MAKFTPIIDKDLGYAAAQENIKALSHLSVKVGVTQAEGGKPSKERLVKAVGKGADKTYKTVGYAQGKATIAEIAAYNEYGVPDMKIPSRPFIRHWTEDNAEEIKRTVDKIYDKVESGKWTAEEAIKRLGEFGASGIKAYIRDGDFQGNAETTIRRKKSSKPLIDTGTMRNSVGYEVVRT
jgi:hypothetical protein